jgi:hypothetical protein
VTRTPTGTRTATPTWSATATVTVTETGTALPVATATPTPLCGSGVLIEEARLDVAHNLNPAGDETMKISGWMQLSQLSPAIDPSTHGFTLTVFGANGATLFSRYVPGGVSPSPGAPGWRAATGKWKFKDQTGSLAAGITKVNVKQRAPGLLTFKVLGKANAFQVPQANTHVALLITPGDAGTAAAGQCAMRTFGNANDGPPRCVFLASYNRFKCR